MALATGAGSDPSSTKPVFGPLVVFGLGHAGAPPADTAALADLLLRVSRMADDLPELAELELTVLAGPGRGPRHGRAGPGRAGRAHRSVPAPAALIRRPPG